jgi:formamidopyrimidine-DNA glycosylase
MPELPEVEAVVRYLRPRLSGKTAVGLSLPPGSRALAAPSRSAFDRAVAGQAVRTVGRRGKYLLLMLDRGAIGIHLRMTGHLRLGEPDPAEKKYVTARLKFSDKTVLCLKDTRKFGRIFYWSSTTELDRKLGVEPLSPEFTPARLQSLLLERSRKMKPLLLDQRLVAGLGNIYADEVLWQAEIHPAARSSSLPRKRIMKLHRAIRTILRNSIRMNGTTFSTFFFGDNRSGRFHRYLKVFGRTGEPCRRCRTLIIKIRIAQRGTHICPRCQRA